MATRQLGAHVLTKIENLITEIDKPAPHSTLRKQAQTELQQFKTKKDQQSNKYSKMSYSYRKKQKEREEILKDQIYQNQEDLSSFKVSNKNTLKIISKKEWKPIHERVDEIIAKKKRYIKGVQSYYEQQQKRSMRPQIYTQLSPDKKFNEIELEQYCYDLAEKNKERIKKNHMRKLHLVKKQDSKIPIVDKLSKSLSQIRNCKKKYSDNVFQRLEQYSFQLRKNKKQLIRNRTQEQGNFSPVLCNKSIQLAAKVKNQANRSRKSLHHQSRCQVERNSSPKEKKSISKSNRKSLSKTHQKTKPKVKVSQQTKNKVNVSKDNKSFQKSAVSKSVSPLKEKNTNLSLKQTPKTATTKKIKNTSKSPTLKLQKQN